MNVLPADEPIDPSLWERPQIRTALARHDISTVYRLLGGAGIAQRRIAQLTGQSQSDVSEIAGGRQVQAYDLLVRIAEGFGIPRGYMGLAYTDAVTRLLAASTAAVIEKDDDPMERRTFLGVVSKLVVGATLTTAEVDLLTVSPELTPAPRRVGATEVTQLKALTSALRTYDASHGGGSCRDAVLAQMQWAESLLSAAASDRVRPALLSAVADLKTLAGWTAHDLGLAHEARGYLAQAV
ncbi:helix-turn-helix domain-containing protein [Actinoalloteichus fjordicus]|uniref:Uncharacterized protein n=2 Tax=Actinoalloteichus TaxID=65496 RepID=A0AAC9PQE3_9PSEU|nr:helix-turn-helix transcriptional regulator [Actinoalloteichus fjordicus]APU12938.1 hypothetical protein UA74_04295 [Actinoalloteichus fjordicus]